MEFWFPMNLDKSFPLKPSSDLDKILLLPAELRAYDVFVDVMSSSDPTSRPQIAFLPPLPY